ncbi:hypothetical protein GF336_06910 [Candidatus Woesearchaeota archaeon]|nr:hypothetical protein [Candidatus Woesearchaeota archaeon]
MKKERYIKICPHCGSTGIRIPPAGMDIRMTQPDYCESCHNRGIFPEIKESEVAEFKKNLKKKS